MSIHCRSMNGQHVQVERGGLDGVDFTARAQHEHNKLGVTTVNCPLTETVRDFSGGIAHNRPFVPGERAGYNTGTNSIVLRPRAAAESRQS